MFNSILVVCTGNICRSPIAERLLQHMLPKKKISSAGLGALVDHAADETASLVAANHGVSLDGHQARQFTGTLGRQFDLLLVMEKQQLEQISKIAPELRGKTMLLGHWLGSKEIPDPYRQSTEAYEFIYQLLDKACTGWVNKLGG